MLYATFKCRKSFMILVIKKINTYTTPQSKEKNKFLLFCLSQKSGCCEIYSKRKKGDTSTVDFVFTCRNATI